MRSFAAIPMSTTQPMVRSSSDKMYPQLLNFLNNNAEYQGRIVVGEPDVR
jgi:hypothetical protein